MVIVRISDKRYHKGFNLKFFDSESITDEVVDFVRNNPKAYWIESKEETYRNREQFLEAYKEQ